ncbi:hypothetical protein L7F22_025538, partial [Adiantum nelumboides]|nr:hypothetical protein [Adiantum nelumboides]
MGLRQLEGRGGGLNNGLRRVVAAEQRATGSLLHGQQGEAGLGGEMEDMAPAQGRAGGGGETAARA